MRSSRIFRSILPWSLSAFFIASLLPTFSFASPPRRVQADSKVCTELIRECMALESNGRTACFQAASSDERCKGTELSRLAFMRWTASSNPGDQDSLALLGPQMVDQECLGNFDNQLSGELIRGPLSRDATNALISRLESCRSDGTEEMFRP